MAQRQIALFTIGCWGLLVTAVVHLVGHVSGPAPPTNEVEAQLLDVAGSYQFALPGGGRRSLMDFVTGFSLAFSLLVATLGAAGLMVRKRGDVVLVASTARVLAGALVALLVISLTHWFIVPTLFIAFSALCFVLAAVPKPAPPEV
jgi:hypothetical protein